MQDSFKDKQFLCKASHEFHCGNSTNIARSEPWGNATLGSDRNLHLRSIIIAFETTGARSSGINCFFSITWASLFDRQCVKISSLGEVIPQSFVNDSI